MAQEGLRIPTIPTEGFMIRHRCCSFVEVVLLLVIAAFVWSGSRSVSADASETAANDPNVLAQGSITGGDYHTCALLSTGAVKCWGRNNYGQLGDGTLRDSHEPVQVFGLTSGVTAITAGTLHTCAIQNGAAKCWGSGGSGRLGDGNTTLSSNTPVQVLGLTSGVTAITAGGTHTCAIQNGAAKCWGPNTYGQVGDGTFTSPRSTPAQVAGLTSGVAAITAGGSHTCALLDTGAADCWGKGTYGQVGDGGSSDTSAPVQVFGLTSGVTAITAGTLHTCAIQNGAAKCWGSGGDYQVGDGWGVNRDTPAQVWQLTSGVTAITAGWYHTCALLDTGAAKCWGGNSYGQLGDGSITSKSLPKAVSGLTSGVTAISAGATHTCSLLSTNAAKCWGDNGWGRLGDGTTTNSNTPTQVTGLASGVGQTTTTTTVAPTTTSTTVAPTTTSSTTSSTTTMAPSMTTIAPSTSSPTVPPTIGPVNISTAPNTQSSTTTTTTSTATSTPLATSTSDALTTTTTTASATTTTESESAPDIEEFLGSSIKDVSTLVDQTDTALGAALIINGTPTTVEVTTTTTSTKLTFEFASLDVTCFDPDGQPIALSSQGRFTVRHGDTVAITATGFAPGSRINVAVFSDPVALGTTTIDDSGNATQRWAIPDSIDAGDHTLVVSGDLVRAKNAVFGLRIVVDRVSFITRIATNAWTRIIVALGIAGGLLIPANRHRRSKV